MTIQKDFSNAKAMDIKIVERGSRRKNINNDSKESGSTSSEIDNLKNSKK